MDFYTNYNTGVAYQKHMEFSPSNERFSFMNYEPMKQDGASLVPPTKWEDIAKVVLNKDKSVLDCVLSEINPTYRNKLLDKPLIPEKLTPKPKAKKSTKKLPVKLSTKTRLKKLEEVKEEEEPDRK